METPPRVVRIEVNSDDPDRFLLESMERLHRRTRRPSWLWHPIKRLRWERTKDAIDELRFCLDLRDAVIRGGQ